MYSPSKTLSICSPFQQYNTHPRNKMSHVLFVPLPPLPSPPRQSKTCTFLLYNKPAAGTHSTPQWPRLTGSKTFRGTQIHSSQYQHADEFRGKKVAVVGAGNSGAQILAEVSAPGVASSALWSTLEEPSFLPMGLSGKEIFDTGKPGGERCGGI